MRAAGKPTFLFLLALIFALAAQRPLERRTSALSDEFCAEGEKLLGAGNREQARAKFLSALWHDPHHVGALKGLLAAS